MDRGRRERSRSPAITNDRERDRHRDRRERDRRDTEHRSHGESSQGPLPSGRSREHQYREKDKRSEESRDIYTQSGRQDHRDHTSHKVRETDRHDMRDVGRETRERDHRPADDRTRTTGREGYKEQDLQYNDSQGRDFDRQARDRAGRDVRPDSRRDRETRRARDQNRNERQPQQREQRRPRDHRQRRDNPHEYEHAANEDNEGEENPTNVEEPNYGLSGKLTEYTNTYKGVVIKYNEPPESRKPNTRWRLYPFKGEESMPVMYIHRQSAYLLGRQRHIADIAIDHPSCSKQHAVLQYRLVNYDKPDGTVGRRVKPYILDLESANGTFLNNQKVDPRRYYELKERDVLKFGFSSREYVLLHEKSSKGVEEEEKEVGSSSDGEGDGDGDTPET